MMLDLDDVRLFVLAAEHGNLTRAAEAAGTVQPVVSQRIKRLEAVLGRRLLDRSPRLVRLTAEGSDFLVRSRALLAAHEAAIAPIELTPSHVSVGISDHALGTRLEWVLKRIKGILPPHATISAYLGSSADVRERYSAGTIDLALIRRESGADEGEVLGEDPLDWRVPEGWRRPDGPLPLVLLPGPCAVRAVAIRTLDRNGIPWRETFTGGTCSTLISAVQAGLGVAPLGSIVGDDLLIAPPTRDLPALPSSQIVMLARSANPATSAVAKHFSTSIRKMLRS
jgi:DNA-binding transcriptional LysR family regulator